jgi:hypothetical protein
VKHRYGALRTIAVIYKVLGVIVGIITLFGSLFICGAALFGGAVLSRNGLENTPFGPGAGMVGGVVGGLLALLYGLLIALFLYAFGEGIYLLLALEENTRLAATLLQQNIHSSGAPLPPAHAPPSLPQA